MNIQNVYLQKSEYENARVQLNEGLDVFAADMTMSRLEKANVFSFVVLLIFVICVHGNVDLHIRERVAVLCLSHYSACVVEPDYTLRRPRLALLTFFFIFSLFKCDLILLLIYKWF